jgi:arabinose-5-phosphate isomerase
MSTLNADIQVSAVALPTDRFPVVGQRTLLKQVLEEMTARSMGIACVVSDTDGSFLGVFTDGDLRRVLLRNQKPLPALLTDDVILHATRNCTTIRPDDRLIDAVKVMEDRAIWDIPVVVQGRLVGLLHLHPAIKHVLGN